MPAPIETSAQRWRRLHGPSIDPRLLRAAREADPIQLEADRLRKLQRWVRLRAWFLRGHPLCVSCLAVGRSEAAAEVDHIEPVRALLLRGQPERVFDPENLQALCVPCHAAKSAADRRGIAARRAPSAPPGGGPASTTGGGGCVSYRGDAESVRAPLPKFTRVSGPVGVPGPGGPGVEA